MDQTYSRGPRRPIVIIAVGFLAVGLVDWTFPEVQERDSICEDCGAGRVYLHETRCLPLREEYQEKIGAPQRTVPDAADHRHRWGDGIGGDFHRVPRWRL